VTFDVRRCASQGQQVMSAIAPGPNGIVGTPISAGCSTGASLKNAPPPAVGLPVRPLSATEVAPRTAAEEIVTFWSTEIRRRAPGEERRISGTPQRPGR
jgi:hypothetical protein